MKLPLEIFVGLRYTRAKRRNHYISFISAISMLGIALGVMALIVVLSVMNGFENELRGRVVQIIEENGKVRVVVDAGIWVALLISKKRYQEIRFMVGETINLYIPPEAVHLI